MASPAGHHLASAEVGLVDSRNHVHHIARHPLSRRVGRPIDPVRTSVGVTIRTVELKRRGHDAHRLQEIIHGNTLQCLDVLEDLVRQKGVPLRRSLPACYGSTGQPDNCDSNYCK